MNRKMPLYTIPHHVNSFVTEWILIYLYNFLFSVFLFSDFFFYKTTAANTFSIAELRKGHALLLFISSSFMLSFCLVSFSSQKKISLFFFFYPCFNLTRFFEVASAWASSSWSSTFGLQTATSPPIKSGFQKSWRPVSGLM